MDFRSNGATSSSGRAGGAFRRAESRCDRIPHLIERWEHSEKRQRASAHDFLVVYENLEFAVVTTFQLDFFTELFPDLGGRTGRLDPCDSISAATDSDSHGTLLSCAASARRLA
jgi:hypothetical protein